jgi:hypothetical protein
MREAARVTLTVDPRSDEEHGVRLAVAVARSAQTAVIAAPAETSEDAGLFRAFVKGSIIGFVAVFVLLGGMILAVGMGIAAALGVGAFTAVWGGPGFGGMMGAILHDSRTERT